MAQHLLKSPQDFAGQEAYYRWADSLDTHYFRQNKDLLQKIELAEKYFSTDSLVAYFFLQSIAQNAQDCEICISKLKKYKILASKISGFQKFWHHLSKGNLGYIFTRFGQQIGNFGKYYAQLLGIKIWGFWVLLFLFYVVSFFFLRKIKAYLILCITSLSSFITIYNIFPQNTLSIQIQEKNHFELYKTQNNRHIGYVIYLPKHQVKATILQGKNVYKRYQQLRSKEKIALFTSLVFTDPNGKQEGLAMNQGKVQNQILLPNLDGLLYTDKGNLSVKNKKSHTLLAYLDFLKQAQKDKLTVAQTMLLYYEKQILIAPQKNPKERERRILALVKDPHTQKELYIIFEITTAYPLFDISKGIIDFLQHKNMKIQALMNIDVGGNNIFEYQHPNHRKLKGFFEVSKAESLLIFSQK